MKEFDNSEIKLYLSNNFLKAESLIDATQATFIISDNIPSPMGAFLSALTTREEAEKLKTEKGGTLYSWTELKEHLK
jgi:copper chaperone NosL